MAVSWNDRYLLNHTSWLDEAQGGGEYPVNGSNSKPAFRLAYGDLEQHIVRRRTETDEQFQIRRDFYAPFAVMDNSWDLYHKLKGNCALRDIVLKEYTGSNHASVGAVALTDGIDYFVDW